MRRGNKTKRIAVFAAAALALNAFASAPLAQEEAIETVTDEIETVLDFAELEGEAVGEAVVDETADETAGVATMEADDVSLMADESEGQVVEPGKYIKYNGKVYHVLDSDNIISGGDFESNPSINGTSNTSGIVDQMLFNGTSNVTSDEAHGGNQSLALSGNGSVWIWRHDFSDESKLYVYSVWYKLGDDINFSDDNRHVAGTTDVATNTTHYNEIGRGTAATGDWQQDICVFNPSGARFSNYFVLNGSGTMYVDDMVIYEVEEVDIEINECFVDDEDLNYYETIPAGEGTYRVNISCTNSLDEESFVTFVLVKFEDDKLVEIKHERMKIMAAKIEKGDLTTSTTLLSCEFSVDADEDVSKLKYIAYLAESSSDPFDIVGSANDTNPAIFYGEGYNVDDTDTDTDVTTENSDIEVYLAKGIVGDTMNIDVEIENDSKSRHIIGVVTKDGVNVNFANTLAFGYAQTAYDTATGKYVATVKIRMPDDVETGTYTVTVGVGGGDTKTTYAKCKYLDVDDRTSVLELVNTAETAAEIVNKIDSLPFCLGCFGANAYGDDVDSLTTADDFYDGLTAADKTDFAQYIIDNRGTEELDMSGFASLANEALVVTYVTGSYGSSDSDRERASLGLEVLKANAEVSGLDLTDDDFTKLGNAAGLFEAMVAQSEAEGTEIKTIEDVANIIKEAVVIERINEVGFLEVATVIGENIDYFTGDAEISEDEIETVTKTNKMKDLFGKSIKKSGETYRLPAYTFEDIKKAWDRAYDDAKEQYKNSGSSGGSGGGSGSSSSSSSGKTSSNTSITSVKIDQSVVRDDPLDVKKLIGDYYDDMTGYEWAESAVLALTEDGIVNGTGEMKFEPARTLKREEFMKLLVNTFNLADMKATCTFTDVTDQSAWYYVYIASAQQAGITTGRGDGTFGLGEDVTREEMATLVYRAAINAGLKLTSTATSATLMSYSDISALSDYAVEAVSTLTSCGIMKGSDGKFSPADGASRAQAAVVINNIKNGYMTSTTN